jgi:single-strand DNA-binding protein
MANLNKVFLIGRLTRDPELRYTPGGMGVTEFGLAVNRVYTTASGEKKEETCFVDVNLWGRRGEIAKEHLRKGSPIFIEGRLDYRQWEAQDGSKRSKLRVVGENFQFLGAPARREAPVAGDQLDPADFGFGPGNEPPADVDDAAGGPPPGQARQGGGPPEDGALGEAAGGENNLPF